MDHAPTRRMSLTAMVAIVTLATVTFLLGRYLPRRAASPITQCLENLRAIQGATREWAAALHKTANDRPSWDALRPYLIRHNKSHYACPVGGRYLLGTADAPPTCSEPGHTLQ